ncbi:MAG TPA: heavy-metal-associated domain-containing protein [Bdellovibrionota bacterium]|jgi:mercuric ion binding protein|nr:heavy-metal-associated domain-containing protein [Bdellovibrionota bacterium]
MKVLRGLLLSLLLLTAPMAFGREISISVRGMVCSFCAQGIEKKFSAEPAVQKVTVRLSEKTVSLTLKEGQDVSDDRIRSVLTESGYNVRSIERK